MYSSDFINYSFIIKCFCGVHAPKTTLIQPPQKKIQPSVVLSVGQFLNFATLNFSYPKKKIKIKIRRL
jgi:hypothetical protein